MLMMQLLSHRHLKREKTRKRERRIRSINIKEVRALQAVKTVNLDMRRPMMKIKTTKMNKLLLKT